MSFALFLARPYALPFTLGVSLGAPAVCLAQPAQALEEAGATMATVQVTASSEDDQPRYTATHSQIGKSDAPLLETAQSVAAITRPAMDDRAAQTVSEALRYSAGTLAAPFGEDRRFDWPFLRGFSALYDIYRDGLRQQGLGFAIPKSHAYGLERVDMLRGPASVLYGQGNPGGLVNLVTKRPTDTPYHEVGMTAGSFDNEQLFADLSDQLDQSGAWRYRLTTLGRDARGRVAHTDNKSFYLAPALSWQPSAATTLTLLSQFQADRSTASITGTPTPQLIAAFTAMGLKPGTIPQGRNLGNPDFDRFHRDYTALGYLLEHRLNDSWSLAQNVRYEVTDLDYRHAELKGVAITPRFETALTQSAIMDEEKVATLLLDQRLTGQWSQGALDYTLSAGLDYSQLRAGLRSKTGNTLYLLNAFNPSPSYPQITLPRTVTRDQAVEGENTGLYVQNRFKWQERWILKLAGRQDWVSKDSHNRLSDAQEERDEEATSGQTSLMYLSPQGLAPYISYSTGFNPVFETDAHGRAMDAETARQTEVGLKWQPAQGGLMLSLAAFDLSKKNVVTTDPQGKKSQTGAVRIRGLELEGSLDLTPGLKAVAAYTLNHATITADKNHPGRVGSNPPLTPDHQANAWLDYTVQTGPLQGLGLGAGLRYVGAMDYAQDGLLPGSDVALHLRGYTLLDTALRYQRQNWLFALNVSNLEDQEVIAWCTGQLCQYGEERIATASARYRW